MTPFDIGPNLVNAIKVIAIALCVFAFFRYVIGSKA